MATFRRDFREFLSAAVGLNSQHYRVSVLLWRCREGERRKSMEMLLDLMCVPVVFERKIVLFVFIITARVAAHSLFFGGRRVG